MNEVEPYPMHIDLRRLGKDINYTPITSPGIKKPNENGDICGEPFRF